MLKRTGVLLVNTLVLIASVGACGGTSGGGGTVVADSNGSTPAEDVAPADVADATADIAPDIVDAHLDSTQPDVDGQDVVGDMLGTDVESAEIDAAADVEDVDAAVPDATPDADAALGIDTEVVDAAPDAPADAAIAADTAGDAVDATDTTPSDPCACGTGCDGKPCNDGSACTLGDFCAKGQCVGSAKLCSDGNACTMDACAISGTCVFQPLAAGSCSDSNPCTASDTCKSGACSGTPISCNDSNPCTADSCSTSTGCVHTPISGACNGTGVCYSGTCCTPQCGGVDCGDDGCGGSCGTCPGGTTCQPDGTCVAPTACGSVSYQGCCDGQNIKYCENNVLTAGTCQSSCGWDATNGYYNCDVPAGADPSGSFPEACPAVVACVPDYGQACCGSNLCTVDSCGVVGAVMKTCAAGCDVATDTCAAGGCGSVTPEGYCNAAKTGFTYCSIPTDSGQPEVLSVTCLATESCTTSKGYADCEVKPGKCQPGSSKCLDASTLSSCDATGTGVAAACAGCVDTVLGAACSGVVASQPLTMKFSYEAKAINAGLTGWDPTVVILPLEGATAIAEHQDATTGETTLMDAALTGADGSVTLQVPTDPGADDAITVLLVHSSTAGATVDYAVAQPDVPDATAQPMNVPVPAATSQFWAWSLPPAQWLDGGQVTIGTADGSGAARLFEVLYGVHDIAAGMAGTDPLSLVVWLRFNTGWSCGACFSQVGAGVAGLQFDSQIWYPGLTANEEYWADAVMGHELGHWVMASYGKSPYEGGPHMLGVPTYPGQAWSEGWATFWSSFVRGDSLYYDKQGGSFFWVDLSPKTYSTGGSLVAANPAGPLLQKMDENLVAATLWALADQTNPPADQSGNQVFMDALQSPRMTVAPYARGYTTHQWQLDTSVSPPAFNNVVDTLKPAPMLADALDALECLGVPAATVQGILAGFPYPTNAPLCK